MTRSAWFIVAALAGPTVAAAQGGGAGAASHVEAPADRDAVIAAAQALLATIGARDTATARRLLVPGSQLGGVSQSGTGTMPRYQSDSAFLRLIAATPQRLLERMWSPTVILHGALAEVHAPYDFHIDGKFSHCGTDVFTLVRTPTGWRIAALMWTVQPTGCEASPLGPPA
jgi:hypothetical protein